VTVENFLPDPLLFGAGGGGAGSSTGGLGGPSTVEGTSSGGNGASSSSFASSPSDFGSGGGVGSVFVDTVEEELIPRPASPGASGYVLIKYETP
jgi:hypothetical protein